jgi:D-alanine-D-alanine ligase
MKVLVLSGGTSDEREVSIRSGKNVIKALTVAGYEVTNLDPKIAKNNELKKACQIADIVFIALHGKGGEDGSLQKKLEQWNTKYTGSSVVSSKNCIDKAIMRRIAENAQITIAAGEYVTGNNYLKSKLINAPYVLKPVIGGSSIDTFVVRKPNKAPIADIELALAKYGKMLIEELIEGTEITVGVLGKKALPVIEIIPPHNQEFDYKNKYNGKTQELCPPQNVSKNIQKKAQQEAEKLHVLFGCRDMSRADFIVKHDGALVLIDINTVPGLTEQSLLPKAAATAGITMTELVTKLVTLAKLHKPTLSQ